MKQKPECYHKHSGFLLHLDFIIYEIAETEVIL